MASPGWTWAGSAPDPIGPPEAAAGIGATGRVGWTDATAAGACPPPLSATATTRATTARASAIAEAAPVMTNRVSRRLGERSGGGGAGCIASRVSTQRRDA